MGRIDRARRLLAAFALACSANGAYAASPGPFQVDGQGFIFDNPGQTTPQGSQLEYPLACVTPAGGGRQSILTGAGPPVWRTITLDPTEQAFYTEGGPQVPYPAIAFTQGNLLMVGPVDASGAPKVYTEMLVDFGSLRPVGLFDFGTGALEHVALTFGLPVALIDVDGDGLPEAIVLNDPTYQVLTISVMDAQLTHQLFYAPITFADSTAFAVGRFDSTGKAEIVTSAGLVYQLTATGMTQVGTIPATVNGSQISLLAAGDVNGDGVDEIIAVYATTIVAYNFNTQSTLWQVTPTLNSQDLMTTLSVIDLYGTGHPQILAGQQADNPAIAQGGIYVFDGATGTQQLAFAHPDQGLTSLAACDVEGTGTLDLVSEQWIYDGASRLYVNDARTGAQKYRSNNEAGPVEGVVIADVEGSGSPEVVFMPNGIVGDGDLALHARDAATFARKWDTPSPFLPVLGTGALDTLVAGNAMGDGHTDLVVGSTQNGNGIIWVVDGPTHALVQTIQLDPGDNVGAVVLADLDGTGTPKIVAGIWGYTPAIPRLEIIDGATGTRLSHVAIGSEPLAVLKLKVADLNLDGHDDVIVHMNIDYNGGPEIYVLDGATQAIRSLAITNVNAFDSIVMGAGAPLDIAVAHADSTIELFDSTSAASLGKHMACASGIAALSRDNLSSAGPEEVLFTCGNQIAWMALPTGATQLITANVGNYLGTSDNLFSFGSSPSTDRILVNSNIGIAHLSATPGLAPYVYPVNAASTNAWGTHWSTAGGGLISSGTFDGSAVPPTLTLVSQATHGTVTVQASQFQYVPTGAPYAGPDFFTVQASNTEGTSPPTTLMIVLEDVAPIMNPSTATLTVAPGASGPVTIPAQDADGDPLTYQIVQMPTQGTVTINGDQAIYTANAGSSGSDTFSVRAFDQLQYSEPLVVTVTIAAAAPPPPPPPTPPSPPAPSPGGGGGGSVDPLTLGILLLWMLMQADRSRRRRPETRQVTR